MEITSYFNVIVVFIWLFSVAISLLGIRNKNFTGIERGLWALIVLFIPFIGAIAYLLIGARKLT